jgi:hypothetical protein
MGGIEMCPRWPDSKRGIQSVVDASVCCSVKGVLESNDRNGWAKAVREKRRKLKNTLLHTGHIQPAGTNQAIKDAVAWLEDGLLWACKGKEQDAYNCMKRAKDCLTSIRIPEGK